MAEIYKTYARILIEGDATYIKECKERLDQVEAISDGARLLTAICDKIHTVTIHHTDTGNACSPKVWGAYPKLLQAIHRESQTDFENELTATLTKAEKGGITLEHLARQLAIGLSPATYVGEVNVSKPKPKFSFFRPKGIEKQIEKCMDLLEELASGERPLKKLPKGWDYQLPRLLRLYLEPGSGSNSEVHFHTTKTFYCVEDPAMHQRPPAIGLAHELIHALHNSRGMNLGLIKNKSDENIEEIITTGFPPYQYEEFSDNKLRTQWPTNLEIRRNY